MLSTLHMTLEDCIFSYKICSLEWLIIGYSWIHVSFCVGEFLLWDLWIIAENQSQALPTKKSRWSPLQNPFVHVEISNDIVFFDILANNIGLVLGEMSNPRHNNFGEISDERCPLSAAKCRLQVLNVSSSQGFVDYCLYLTLVSVHLYRLLSFV